MRPSQPLRPARDLVVQFTRRGIEFVAQFVACDIKFTAQFNGCGFDGASNACVACVEIGLAQRTFAFSPLLIDHGQAVERVAKFVAELVACGCAIEKCCGMMFCPVSRRQIRSTPNMQNSI